MESRVEAIIKARARGELSSLEAIEAITKELHDQPGRPGQAQFEGQP